MKKLSLLVTIAVNYFSAAAQDVAKIEEVMNLFAGQNKFNGTVLVAHKGKIILDKGYGFRDADKKITHESNSIFQIGSITKQFTSSLILRLQEEKKLNVKDKLSKYFPGYPNGDSVTIEQLLSHTSGIYSYTNDQKFMSDEVFKPTDRNKMLALFKDKPYDFSPGSNWNYSNSGYMLLGYIIEDVAKMPYEKAVRKYLFDKAKMTHSGFDFSHLNHVNKSIGYLRLTNDGNRPAQIVDSSVSYAAGAIYSTTGDLYKWFTSLQQNKIISPSSKSMAFTPVKNKYGYGWGIDSLKGLRTIGHSGGIFGFTSNMLNVFEDSTTVILLSNVSTPHLNAITQYIFAILYNHPYELPKERISITLPDDVLKQYTGTYELTPQLIITISFEGGKLIGKPEGQEALQLHPEKKDFFFLKEIEAQVRFNRNEKDEVISMTLFQNGNEMTGKKR